MRWEKGKEVRSKDGKKKTRKSYVEVKSVVMSHSAVTQRDEIVNSEEQCSRRVSNLRRNELKTTNGPLVAASCYIVLLLAVTRTSFR